MRINLSITLLCYCVIWPLPEQVERKGVGVIGVIECNFLQPTHNKQDFDDTDKYRSLHRISLDPFTLFLLNLYFLFGLMR